MTFITLPGASVALWDSIKRGYQKVISSEHGTTGNWLVCDYKNTLGLLP